jgi:hypothetical protein
VNLSNSILSSSKHFFDVLVDLVLNTVTAIKHFRRNDIEIAVVVANWTTVLRTFADNLRKIAVKVDLLQKLVEAQNITQLNGTQARLAQSLSYLNVNIAMGGHSHDVNVPCNTLPDQRNSHFYRRRDVLQKIDRHLKPREGDSLIRSVALWGTGGIGKLQIALECVQQQWVAGRSVILWIASETEAEVSKSFNEAASRLQLPGYLATNTPDQNRYLVLQWLQISSKFLNSQSSFHHDRHSLATRV